MIQSRWWSGRTRNGESSAALCGRAFAPTRAFSPRQLPTDQDHDGEPLARSANIRLINRRFCAPGHHPLCVIHPIELGSG